MDLIVILSFIDTCILGSFAIFRTWNNWRMYCVQQKMLEESRAYWNSWKERSKDVAEKVLSEISTSELKAELKKRTKKRRKKKECQPPPSVNTQDNTK